MRKAIVLIGCMVVLAVAWYAVRLSPATRSAPGNDAPPPAAAHVRPSLPSPQSQEDAAAVSAAAARRPEGPPRQAQAAVDFAQRRAALERRANKGDMAAAAELGELLSQCQYYSPMRPEQIEDTVVTGLAADVEPPQLGGQPVSPELLMLLMQEGYAELERHCAGTQNAITAADFPAALEWLRRAAEAGDAGAMVSYAMYSAQGAGLVTASDGPTLARDLKAGSQRAGDYLDRAVRAGDARALLVRADAYANGTLKPRDDIAAYADMHALARTELGRAWPPRLVELYLQALAAPLDAAQLVQAQARGDAVWRECCASRAR
jgi:TPR repeat protein